LSNNFDVQTFFASRWQDRHFDWDSLVEDVQCRKDFCNVMGTEIFARRCACEIFGNITMQQVGTIQNINW